MMDADDGGCGEIDVVLGRHKCAHSSLAAVGFAAGSAVAAVVDDGGDDGDYGTAAADDGTADDDGGPPPLLLLLLPPFHQPPFPAVYAHGHAHGSPQRRHGPRHLSLISSSTGQMSTSY